MVYKSTGAHHKIGGLIWVLLGAGIAFESTRLRLGEFANPGPGFMPFLSGILLALLGLILIGSSMSVSRRKSDKTKTGNSEQQKNWRMPLLALVSLFGYFLLLNHLGFYLTAFLFLLFLFKLTDPSSWLSPIGYAATSVVLSYLVFSRWLMVQFPSGIFGF